MNRLIECIFSLETRLLTKGRLDAEREVRQFVIDNEIDL